MTSNPGTSVIFSTAFCGVRNSARRPSRCASPHRLDRVYQMDVNLHVTNDGGETFTEMESQTNLIVFAVDTDCVQNSLLVRGLTDQIDSDRFIIRSIDQLDVCTCLVNTSVGVRTPQR